MQKINRKLRFNELLFLKKNEFRFVFGSSPKSVDNNNRCTQKSFFVQCVSNHCDALSTSATLSNHAIEAPFVYPMIK